MDNPNETLKKRWLNPEELDAEYGIRPSNQAKLRMQRKIPFSKIGGYVKYDRFEIDKWLESHSVQVVA